MIHAAAISIDFVGVVGAAALYPCLSSTDYAQVYPRRGCRTSRTGRDVPDVGVITVAGTTVITPTHQDDQDQAVRRNYQAVYQCQRRAALIPGAADFPTIQTSVTRRGSV